MRVDRHSIQILVSLPLRRAEQHLSNHPGLHGFEVRKNVRRRVVLTSTKLVKSSSRKSHGDGAHVLCTHLQNYRKLQVKQIYESHELAMSKRDCPGSGVEFGKPAILRRFGPPDAIKVGERLTCGVDRDLQELTSQAHAQAIRVSL
jgi:hypothetical protein